MKQRYRYLRLCLPAEETASFSSNSVSSVRLAIMCIFKESLGEKRLFSKVASEYSSWTRRLL